MSVRKFKQSWWVDIRFNRVRYRRRSPTNSRAGARAFEATLRQRLALGQPVREPGTEALRFSAFSAEWYDGYVTTNNKRSEQKTKETCLRVHLVPFFGHSRLAEITPRLIEQYKAEKISDGLSPKTVNNHLIILSKCLRTAEEWELLDRPPKIRMLRVPPQPYRFLSVLECEELLAAARTTVWRRMLLTAMRTGMRLGELLALDWSDVDLDRRFIRVRRSLSMGEITSPKNNRERYVAMSDQLLLALGAESTRKGFVFAADDGGHLSKAAAEGAIKRISRRAGVRQIGWHVLRHTFASHLVAAGVPLRVVQELLGHATIQMTTRYAHLAPTSLLSAVAVLDAQCAPTTIGQPVGNPTLPAVPAPVATMPQIG